MLVQPELVKKMKDFGLNSYEAKIWAALLSRGVSSAGELSDISNVPRSRTYDVLESLEKKGFIMMKLGKPIKYMALPPSEVINVIKKRVKEESTKHEAQLEELRNSQILNELTTLHTTGIELVEPTDYVGLIKDRTNVYDHMESMIKNADKTVYIMTSHDGLTRKSQYMRKTLKKLADKGISIKVLVPFTKDLNKYSEELKGVAEVRTVQNMTSRFVIVDDAHILFMITDDKHVHPSYDVGVWIKTPYFAAALKEMFEQMWKRK
ncbi:TrmB family transcriptional regulator [Candidatus Woesearchaeota archaeon]|nr:TrmB family transcriptional regulator [Candidatus Woesearchaeota archaeon]HIJ01093.1 TrmB family transcriptional regulator [Candidatus Woesearchaeota archaeon]HIJ13231.1 TrmB family transcriptional regulator [Candidatus Woesearchaeota archaeon]